MGLRLNGWQRIGIVLSVTWFIGCMGLVVFWEVQSIDDTFSLMLKGCNDTINVFDKMRPNVTDEEYAASRASYVGCQDSARAIYQSSFGALRHERHDLALLNLAAIAFVWLFAWLAIGTTRWIKAGFRA
jgi:hypothetical protein